MWLKIVLMLAFLTVSLGTALKEQQVRYDNYQVYKIKVDDMEKLVKLKAFGRDFKLDFWREVREFGDSCDVMVSPAKQQTFVNLLKQANFTFDLKVQNLQSLIDAQKPKTRAQLGLEWSNYHGLEEIQVWLDEIAERYPKIVTPFSIGRSYEGRDIKGIKISYKPGNKAVFIESNIHAIEWITSATITYIINELLVSHDPGVRDIAENLDWYIIPVLNVDGFVYTHEVNPIWRKSRRPADPAGNCIGTDLNRNFDFKWMVAGASEDPCTHFYAGPYAESDPEVKQLVQFINQTIPDDTIKIYIALHSFGQYVLLPWGHTDEEFPDNYEQMQAVAKGYADALKQRYGTIYTHGSSATTLYKVSGSAKDWAYGVKGIPISYTIELRDKGTYGFLLPPEQIIPVAEEVLDGFVGMVQAARINGVL